jgi:hypothetical protein
MVIFISAVVRIPNIAQYGVNLQPCLIKNAKKEHEEVEV